MRADDLAARALIEAGAGGPVLIGAAPRPTSRGLRSFLSRNGIPHQLLDPATDTDARAFIERYAPEPSSCRSRCAPTGEVLRNPSESELARCIGMLDAEPRRHGLRRRIAGSTVPPGSPPRCMRAPKGLSVPGLIDRKRLRSGWRERGIENYFGFPTGIPARRSPAAAHQAQKSARAC